MFKFINKLKTQLGLIALSIITFAIEQSLFGETYGLAYREAIYNLKEKLIANPQDNVTRNEVQIAYKSCRKANELLRVKL